ERKKKEEEEAKKEKESTKPDVTSFIQTERRTPIKAKEKKKDDKPAFVKMDYGKLVDKERDLDEDMAKRMSKSAKSYSLKACKRQIDLLRGRIAQLEEEKQSWISERKDLLNQVLELKNELRIVSQPILGISPPAPHKSSSAFSPSSPIHPRPSSSSSIPTSFSSSLPSPMRSTTLALGRSGHGHISSSTVPLSQSLSAVGSSGKKQHLNSSGYSSMLSPPGSGGVLGKYGQRGTSPSLSPMSSSMMSGGVSMGGYDGANASSSSLSQTSSSSPLSYLLSASLSGIERVKVLKLIERVRSEGVESIDEVDLSGCNIGLGRVKSVCKFLSTLPLLESLSLSNNQLGRKGVQVICASLKNVKTLHTLDLSYNRAGRDEATGNALVKLLEHSPVLTSFNLEGNRLDSNVVKVVKAMSSYCNKVYSLFLGGNEISERHVKSLCEYLSNFTQLSSLSLKGNPLGCRDIQLLSKCISKLPCIRTLDVSSCDLKEHVVHLLGCKNIRHLNLSHNFIKPKHISAALKGISACSFQEIDLSRNVIRDEGVKEICSILLHLETLEKLVLKENSISQVGKQLILKTIRRHGIKCVVFL
ncbi:hypothetical protein ADUPG1_000856, partial [Aduncisulcus paluster]